MKPTLVITHANCFDGHTAAWIYSRYVNREADHEAEFVPAKYGDKPPDCRGRDVVIADFSYPRKEMLAIAGAATLLTVLDHHHTAQQALDGLERQVLVEFGKPIAVVFDMNRSGAGLMWDHYASLWSLGSRPPLVDYVEDRDLWRMQLPNAQEMNANIYAADMTFGGWDELAAVFSDPIGAIQRGAAILKYMRQYGTNALAEARPMGIRVDGGQISGVLCVNLPYMNCSDYLSRMMLERNVDFVVGYFRRGDGRWQFSLRSRNGFDCSEVAKFYGGGGHKEASGFDVEKLDFVFV